MNKTLVIIGSHPRTREAFDFGRTDCDVWMFNEAISNPANIWAKRADVIFQMHVPAIWRNPQNRNDPKHYEWLTTQKDCVVYMQEQYAEVPMAKAYPLQGILDMIGGDPNHFLTSSVPQAMALAAYLAVYDRIEIYGVAMETNSEYQFQREGVSYWYGYLKGQGIDVYFADPTFLAPLYGYEGKVSVEYEKFGERIAELMPEIEKLSGEYTATILDVKKAMEYFIADCSKENENVLVAVISRQRTLGEKLGVLDGARQENERYKEKADKMREASEGEFVFSRQEFESGTKTMSDRAGQVNVEFISLGTQLGIIQNNIRQAAAGSPKRGKFGEIFAQVLRQYLNANNQMALFKGAAQENYMYMAYLDKHIKAAGGSKSEEVLLGAIQKEERIAAL